MKFFKISSSLTGSSFTCIYNGTVIVKNFEDSSTIQIGSEDDETLEMATCACISPNGSEIVVATEKFIIKHYILPDKECVRSVKAHNMPILCMVFDSTGTLVATGSADRSIRVWDVAKGFCTHSFRDHTDIIRSLSFHAKKNVLQLISTSDDNTIRIFDLNEQNCLVSFKDHLSLPTQVAVSSNGLIMASSGRDKVLNFYDLQMYIHIKTVPVMEELESVLILKESHSALFSNVIGSSARSKKGDVTSFVLLTAGVKGVLRFYHVCMADQDILSFAITPLCEVPLSRVPLLPTSSNSAGESEDSAVQLKSIQSLTYLPKSSEVLVVTNDFNLAWFDILSLPKQLQLSSGEEQVHVKPARLLIGSHGDILDMAVLPPSVSTSADSASYRVALVTNSPQVRLLDEKFNCELLEGHRDIVLSVDVSPDGQWIVTSSKDRSCMVWHVGTLSCCAVAEGHTDAIGSVCISGNKASYASRQVFMVSGSSDKILKRWPLSLHAMEATLRKDKLQAIGGAGTVTKLSPSHSIRAHDKDINSVTTSPNDQMVASGSQDKTIRLWNSADLTPIATLTGHKRGIWKLQFSPVDKVLASCSGDRIIKLWSVVDFHVLRTFEGHTASVLSAVFVNHGTQLMSCSADGLVRLWTIRSGECENTFDEHMDKVWTLAPVASAAAAATEAQYFLSGGSDSRLILWKDVTEQEEQQRIAEAEELLVLEQQLQNDIKSKRYGKALHTALTLGHSLKVLHILSTILEEESSDQEKPLSSESLFDSCWSRRLDTYVGELSGDLLEKLVGFLKDWNANARHSYVSQVLLSSLMRVVKLDALLKMKSTQEFLPALLSYSERHFQRIDRLQQSSYMLEYFTSLISLLPVEEVAKPLTADKANKTNAVVKKRAINDDALIDEFWVPDDVVIFKKGEARKSSSKGEDLKSKKRKTIE